MLPMQEEIHGISHRNVKAFYLKHDYSNRSRAKDILVIETDFDPLKAWEGRSRQDYITLLKDLGALQRKAEKLVGHFDRIDIRKAH